MKGAEAKKSKEKKVRAMAGIGVGLARRKQGRPLAGQQRAWVQVGKRGNRNGPEKDGLENLNGRGLLPYAPELCMAWLINKGVNVSLSRSTSRRLFDQFKSGPGWVKLKGAQK